ncbi:MAG: hypothetical protein V4813_06105 [Gemmatimonadota bacterium]
MPLRSLLAPRRSSPFPLSMLYRALVLLAGTAGTAQAQSLDDAIFMDKRVLCAGLVYTREQWTDYWEGTLKRDNGNIGTVTTQQAAFMTAYGVTGRLNVIASLPYVSTRASQGVLQGQSGSQDLSVGVKYNALSTPLTSAGTLNVIGVASFSVPTSDYTADFYPMSIGSRSKRATGRALLSFQAHNGIYVNASGAYTRRGNVTLERPAYYTDGQLFLSNEVQMPDVRDMMLTVGYQRRGLVVPVTFTQQRTLGGGDIRRQDMPFVSNRMNFSRLDARVQYTLPRLPGVVLHAGGSRILDGRNVGQSTTAMVGLLLAGKL